MNQSLMHTLDQNQIYSKGANFDEKNSQKGYSEFMHPPITREKEYMHFNDNFIKEMLKQITDWENNQNNQ